MWRILSLNTSRLGLLLKFSLALVLSLPLVCRAQGTGAWGTGLVEGLLPFVLVPLAVSLIVFAVLILKGRWRFALSTLVLFALIEVLLINSVSQFGFLLALIAGPALLCLMLLATWFLSNPPRLNSVVGQVGLNQYASVQFDSRFARLQHKFMLEVNERGAVHKFSYWLGFSLITLSFVLPLLLHHKVLLLPRLDSIYVFFSFASLVPMEYRYSLPFFVFATPAYVLMALALRRLWLLITTNEVIPHSYTEGAKLVGYLNTCLFIFATLILILSIALKVSDTVAKSMFYLLAISIPWNFFLTELLSFRRAKNRDA
jgi:hypothetical protein